jgi:hypothetical protein
LLAGFRGRLPSLVNDVRPYRRHRWLVAGCCLAVLAASATGQLGNGIHASAASAAAPQSVSLRSGDVPGYAPIDPSIDSFADPNNDDVKAWVHCAAADPLLSALDTQSASDVVSQVFGNGTDQFGTPTLSVASIVFGAGNRPQAASSFALLAGAAFQQCFAATLDANDQAEGLSTPQHRSTVTPLVTPKLGSQSTAFRIDQVLSVNVATTTADTGFTAIQTNALLAVLITASVDASFPEPTRITTVQHLAARMGTPTVPTPKPTVAPPTPQPTPGVLPPLQLPPCTSGVAGDEQQGVAYGNSLDAFLNSSSLGPTLYFASNGMPDIDAVFMGEPSDPHTTNSAWMAGFFDSIAQSGEPDYLTQMFVAFGLSVYDYPEQVNAGGGPTTMHFQYPAFYAALDCALSSGMTSSALSYDLVSQTRWMGSAAIFAGVFSDSLIVALLIEPQACLGLVAHLSEATFLDAFHNVNPSGMAAIATTALQVIAPSGMPEVSNVVPSYPAYDPGFTPVPPPNEPGGNIGPFTFWRTGDLDAALTASLVFAADQAGSGEPETSNTASSALSYVLPRVPTSGTGPTGDYEISYPAWATWAAFLNYLIDGPAAERIATGIPLDTLPDYSRVSVGDAIFPDIIPNQADGAESVDEFNQAFQDQLEANSYSLGAATVEFLQWLRLASSLPDAQMRADMTEQQLMLMAGQEGGSMMRVLVHTNRLQVGWNRTTPVVSYGPPVITAGDIADQFMQAFTDDAAGSTTNASQPLLPSGNLDGALINMSNHTSGGTPTVYASSHMAVMVTGSGFAPESPVNIVGESTPVVLADAWADHTGSFTIPVVVAGRLNAGSHTLVATGRAVDGQTRTLSVAIEVIDLSPSGVPWAAILVPVAGAVVIALTAALLWLSRRRRNLVGAPRAA